MPGRTLKVMAAWLGHTLCMAAWLRMDCHDMNGLILSFLDSLEKELHPEPEVMDTVVRPFQNNNVTSNWDASWGGS